MKFCTIQQGTNNIEIVYRDYWKSLITKNKIYLPRKKSQIPMVNIYPNYICINETGKYYKRRDIKSEF